MGYWIIGLALIVSFSGAAAGLACIRQSTKSVTSRFRLVWLFVASVSLGGVGAGLSIFVSLMGFAVKGSQLRYDTPMITAAAIVSAIAAFVAMMVAGRTVNWTRLIIGSVVMAAGLGVVHMLLLSAIRVQGTVDRSMVSVIAVFVIALLISALTLWFSLTSSSLLILLFGSAVYALLITGMHYAGITGLQVHVDPAAPRPDGDELFNFFVPFFIIGTLSLAVPITAILVAPDRRETRQSGPVATAEPGTAHSPSLAVSSRNARSRNDIRPMEKSR